MGTYTVQSGDSLSIIARDVLGNMSLWPQLATANGLSAPYTIYPGQVLQLPGTGGARLPMPAPLPVRPSAGPPAPVSAGGGVLAWISQNRLLIGGGVLLFAAGMLLLTQKPRKRGKRKRGKRGAES